MAIQSDEVRTSADEATPLAGFAIQFGLLLMQSREVPISIVNDATTHQGQWPAASAVVGRATISDLGRMKWEAGEHAVATGFRGIIASVGVAHALGARNHENSVEFDGQIIGDPGLVYELVAGGEHLRAKVKIRPGRVNPVASTEERVALLTAYGVAKKMFQLSGGFPELGLSRLGTVVVIPFKWLARVNRHDLARLAWLAGWYFPDLPLVFQLREIDGRFSYFVAAERDSLTVGRKSDRLTQDDPSGLTN